MSQSRLRLEKITDEERPKYVRVQKGVTRSWRNTKIEAGLLHRANGIAQPTTAVQTDLTCGQM